MPKEIDKNDVDISTLFKWSKECNIKNGDEIIMTVYMRLNGDAEVSRSRVYALRRSAEYRRILSDSNSDEHLAFIPEIDLIEEQNLIDSILLEWTREYSQEAIRELRLNLPTEPDSEASLEVQEEYQKTVDNWPEERERKIREYIIEHLEYKKRELAIIPIEKLYKDYIRLLVNRLCENEMVKAYREMSVVFGTYKDKEFTKRLFSNVKEFNDLSSSVKDQLTNAYVMLEIDGEDLKK